MGTNGSRTIVDLTADDLTAGAVLSALGDPTRRSIVDRLRSGPYSVVDLAASLPVSRPAVSQHLKVLKDAGLVTDRAEGTKRIYALDASGLETLRAYLDVVWRDGLASFAAELDARNRTERAS